MRNRPLRRVGHCLGFFLCCFVVVWAGLVLSASFLCRIWRFVFGRFQWRWQTRSAQQRWHSATRQWEWNLHGGTQVPGTPLAIADFNGDGKPDVLESGTGTLLVLLGNCDATFKAAATTASAAALQPIAVTDLNGDGKADVVGTFAAT
jgi:hypothetical protein